MPLIFNFSLLNRLNIHLEEFSGTRHESNHLLDNILNIAAAHCIQNSHFKNIIIDSKIIRIVHAHL